MARLIPRLHPLLSRLGVEPGDEACFCDASVYSSGNLMECIYPKFGQERLHIVNDIKTKILRLMQISVEPKDNTRSILYNIIEESHS